MARPAAANGPRLSIGYLELIDRDLHAGRLLCAIDRWLKHHYSF